MSQFPHPLPGPPGVNPGFDKATFEQLFETERVPMVRLATLLVGSVAIAEEVVQEGFVALSERWHMVDQPGGYLRTTVVNGCAAVLRRRSLEARHQAIPSGDPDPEMPAHLIEVREALDCLSERQRVVIVLRYFVDLPDIEIACILDCRPTTVRSLARRAFRVLRKELS